MCFGCDCVRVWMCVCECCSVCLCECVLGFGTVYVRLTVPAFTVVLGEHREGDLLRLSNSK